MGSLDALQVNFGESVYALQVIFGGACLRCAGEFLGLSTLYRLIFGVFGRSIGLFLGPVCALQVKFWGRFTLYRFSFGGLSTLYRLSFGVCLRSSGQFSGSVCALQVYFGGSGYAQQVNFWGRASSKVNFGILHCSTGQFLGVGLRSTGKCW